jgi:hypothetical protein
MALDSTPAIKKRSIIQAKKAHNLPSILAETEEEAT